jgi:hypothetical protein
MSKKKDFFSPKPVLGFRDTYVFDSFTAAEIRSLKRRTEEVTDYENQYYSALEHQRAKIFPELKDSLSQRTRSFEFDRWVRIVTYKYCLCPLSAKGSVLLSPGGRFNIGDIDPVRFPRFPSLYLAEDYPTAFLEKFGCEANDNPTDLSPFDLALCRAESHATIFVKGQIESTLDINDRTSLAGFVKLIQGFRLDRSLSKKAATLRLNPPGFVKNCNQLQSQLLNPQWRLVPQCLDLPSNSQIFGQIVHAAGIEAILFKSPKGSGNCLAIFPDNFHNSESYIEISSEAPPKIECRRLDCNTYLQLI